MMVIMAKKKLDTKLEIKKWDEQPYREFTDGRKFTRAEVALEGTGDGLDTARFEALMYYHADGTSTFVSLMHIDGALDGRSGSVVLRTEGAFDGTTATSRSEVIDATGDLAGLTGTAESASTHDDYPLMPLTLRYELA
jgi:Protein of unknown function (DUF3224)